MTAEEVGIILGAIGTTTGLGSLLFTRYAWKTERRDRQDQFLAQQEIERARLAAEDEERSRQRRADITATQLGIADDPNNTELRVYRFRLKNMGPSYSKYVTASLVDDQGRSRSSRPPGVPLERGDSHIVTLHVPRIAWDPPVPVRLVVAWHGEGGEPFEEISNLTVRHELHPQLYADAADDR